jgi:hypothetical protein
MKAKLLVFLNSLLSRKFLLTLAGAVSLYQIKQYSQMCVLILGYLGVEGGADIVNRYKTRTLTAADVENAVSHNIDDTPDTSKIVSGKLSATPLFDEETEE